jgi:hypothetical protein
MNLRTPLTLLVLITAFGGANGCARAGGPTPATQPSYAGPTLSMVDVVQKINENNQQIPTLWARHYYEATIVDEKSKKSTFVNGDGALLYRRPMGFRLVGKKVMGDAFEVGSTDERYWLKLGGEVDRMWFGEHRNAGKPCVQKIPIQPNLVLEVLGVGVIDTDFAKMPAPVMRFNPDADAYMFVWVTPAGGAGAGPQRLAAQREVWYDRKTFLPRRVMLFDADGRVLLRALLDNHKPVTEGGPQVATLYRLLFPDSGSKMSIQIEEMMLDNKGVPSRKGIVFPGDTPDEAGVREVIKLDKNCPD